MNMILFIYFRVSQLGAVLIMQNTPYVRQVLQNLSTNQSVGLEIWLADDRIIE